jgi:glycosyltransferase involved in cell wall biosynthesis
VRRGASVSRLAVVLSHPTQYYAPWFAWLRWNPAVELRVFYLWDFGVERRRDPRFGLDIAWDVDLLSGYESEFIPNVSRAPGPEGFWGFDNPGLPARLAAWKPDALLLFGYKWATHLRVIAWARLHGVPLLFRGDSHRLGRGRAPLPSRMVLGALFAQFAAFLFVGQANRDYFRSFGVPERKLFFAPHAVDDSRFDPGREEIAAQAAALRQRLGLAKETLLVLFAGKFIEEKQPAALLAAFLALGRRDAALVFVGDGAERGALERIAGSAPPGSVHFLAFANQSEMPSRYLAADLLVLPSRGLYETWGLSINEAMHMGAPALVSDRVGCQRDLVTDGETGWVFPADDSGALRARLGAALDALTAPGGRERLRSAVLRRISGYTYARAAEGLAAALRHIAES